MYGLGYFFVQIKYANGPGRHAGYAGDTGPSHQGLTAEAPVTGLALAASSVGDAAVSEAVPVGVLSGELSVGAGALDVGAETVGSGDAGGVTEGEVSGCAEALAEVVGEDEAGVDGDSLGLAMRLSCGAVVFGFTTGSRSVGRAVGALCFLGGTDVLVGVGLLFRKSGLAASGMTPASFAAHRPPMNSPKMTSMMNPLPTSRPWIRRERMTSRASCRSVGRGEIRGSSLVSVIAGSSMVRSPS